MSGGKYMPGDGEPVDMSEAALGKRYTSEDMYRDMGIDREIEGAVYTDTVTGITYSLRTVAEGPLNPGPGSEDLQQAASDFLRGLGGE